MDLYWHPLWTLSLLLQSLFQFLEVAFLTIPQAALDQQVGWSRRVSFFKSRPDRLYGLTRSGYLLATGTGALCVADFYHDALPFGGWAFLIIGAGYLLLSIGPGD